MIDECFLFHRGEKAFYSMVLGVGWAKCPLIKRLDKLDKNISITFLYGSHTWMDTEMGPRIKELRPDSFVDIHVNNFFLISIVIHAAT